MLDAFQRLGVRGNQLALTLGLNGLAKIFRLALYQAFTRKTKLNLTNYSIKEKKIQIKLPTGYIKLTDHWEREQRRKENTVELKCIVTRSNKYTHTPAYTHSS